jgi:hypothetical protein
LPLSQFSNQPFALPETIRIKIVRIVSKKLSKFEFYNNRSPHKAFDGGKPMEIYDKLNLEGVTPSGLSQKGGIAHETVHLSFAVHWFKEVNTSE